MLSRTPLLHLLHFPHFPPPLPLLRFVFAHNCHESGLISDTEWSIYCDWHSFLLDALLLKFDGIVYLKTDPKVGRRCGRRRGIEEWEGAEKRGRVQREDGSSVEREGKHLRKEHGREERKGKEWGRKGEGCGKGRRGVRNKLDV